MRFWITLHTTDGQPFSKESNLMLPDHVKLKGAMRRGREHVLSLQTIHPQIAGFTLCSGPSVDQLTPLTLPIDMALPDISST